MQMNPRRTTVAAYALCVSIRREAVLPASAIIVIVLVLQTLSHVEVSMVFSP